MSDPCKPPVYARTASSDKQCEDAWKKIMNIARDHSLIVQAYGGVATLALPSEQRKHGVRQDVLTAHQLNEVPANEMLS